MNKLISMNENGVVYIQTTNGKEFGLVSENEILDEDGIKYENKNVFEVLEDAGFELVFNENYENRILEFVEENGEVSHVIFYEDKMDVV